MGETFLDRHGIKSGIKLNDVIEEFKYVYKGQEVKAGDFVNYINGVASKTDYGESVDTAIDNTNAYTGAVISAVKLDENRVFIAHSYGGDRYLYGIVVEINGATITMGTDTVLSTTSQAGYAISTTLLESGNVFIAYSPNYYLYGMIVLIDGTTITKGTETSLVSSSGAGKSISVVLLSNGNVFVAHSYNSSYLYLYGIVCTISGTTITTGSDTAISSTKNTGYQISPVLLPNGNVFIAHSYSSDNYLYGIVCSISGTTITNGSDIALVSSANAGYTISIVALDEHRVFIAHSGGSNYYLYGIVCSISGTTITKGTDTQLSATTYAGIKTSTLVLDDNRVFIAHSHTKNTYYLYGIVCEITGTTIIAGTDTPLEESSTTSSSGYAISSLLLQNGTIFIAHSYDVTSYYLNAQIFGIDYANNIPTNNIVTTEYEQQVTPATEPPFNAVALSSGVGGTDTEHNEQVKIARVYKEVEVEKTVEGNIFPTSWETTSRTQATASDGTTIIASSSYDEDSSPDLATDGDENTEWIANDVSGDLTIKLIEAKKITKMKVRGFTGITLTSLVIQGSNNETDWIDLHSSSDSYSSLTEIDLSNTDYYLYYKISVTGSGNYPRISEWQTSEYIEKVTEVIQ